MAEQSEYDKVPEEPMIEGHKCDCPCDGCFVEKQKRGIKYVAKIKFPKRTTFG